MDDVDTEEIPFTELLALTADMRPPRAPKPTAPPYDFERNGLPAVDGWERAEFALAWVFRFAFYVMVCVALIALVLGLFFVFTTWLTNAISNNA